MSAEPTTTDADGRRDPSPGPGCPVRKLSRPGEALSPSAEHRVDGPHGPRWVVRSHEAARRLIRSEGAVRQAGFGAGQVAPATPDGTGAGAGGVRRRRRVGTRQMRPPILYLEGAEHRSQRKATARYFAPKVTESYRDMMERLSDTLITPVADGREVELTELTLAMAVQVAARVVGLTSSSMPAMTRRLEAFFEGDPAQRIRTPRDLLAKARTATVMLRFHHLDVRPAIRARRKAPQEDVISQLLSVGYRPLEILTECVTYGAAGMATTREFITVAAWHLLDDAAALARYRAADLAGRTALLEEILRLEPVVGHLFRRTTEPVSLTVDGEEQDLPVGTLIDFDVRAINADTELVGADPLRLRADRILGRRDVAGSVLSFGDGSHRCPGAPIAIMESEIFLTRLFSHEVEAVSVPTVGWTDLTEGYDLRRFRVRIRPTG